MLLGEDSSLSFLIKRLKCTSTFDKRVWILSTVWQKAHFVSILIWREHWSSIGTRWTYDWGLFDKNTSVSSCVVIVCTICWGLERVVSECFEFHIQMLLLCFFCHYVALYLISQAAAMGVSFTFWVDGTDIARSFCLVLFISLCSGSFYHNISLIMWFNEQRRLYHQMTGRTSVYLNLGPV